MQIYPMQLFQGKYKKHKYNILFSAKHLSDYTLKNKSASKGSSSDAIELPFLVPQTTIQPKVL